MLDIFSHHIFVELSPTFIHKNGLNNAARKEIVVGWNDQSAVMKRKSV
jgi:hypothetical protein